MQNTLPSWDLSQYYSSHKDQAIYNDLEHAKNQIAEFVARYRGKVAILTSSELLEGFATLNDILVLLHKPTRYLLLAYEAGGDNIDEISQASTQVGELTTNISNELTFWEVELAGRPDLVDLARDEVLVEYSYLLHKTAQKAKHMLSEEVEKVLSLKSLSSIQAWGKLYNDMKAKISVEYDFGDGLKTYRTADLRDKAMDPDRLIRQKATELQNQSYKTNEAIVLESYNNILLDRKVEDSLRGFGDPEDAKLIENEVSRAFVDNLVGVIKENTPFYQKYLGLKREMLGVDTMYSYDVSAGISFAGVDDVVYTWEDCKRIILESFAGFDEDFYLVAKDFFEKNWIDAANRNRKYGGAFMADFAPGFHPVILVNFKGKFEDILTVAHELGHGIHSVLMNRKQSYLNSSYSMTVAEIASLCCETIVFDKLLESVTDPKTKLKLLAIKVEEEAGNIFTGGLGRYLFERKMHETYRQQGPILPDQVRDFWLKEYYGSIFGDSISIAPDSEYLWQSVAHFTYIFYNYVYASGLLISSSIYEVLAEKPGNIDIYKEMLSLGGSVSPVDLLKKLELNIEDRVFWEQGFVLFKKRIGDVEKQWHIVKEIA
jgi:oligoendopeptidase F